MNKNKWSKIILVTILIGIMLAGCASAAATPELYIEREEAAYEPQPERVISSSAEFKDSGYDDEYTATTIDQSQPAAERLVIKNADLVIVVDDPSSSLDVIARMAEDMGGFVVSANLYKTETAEGVSVPQASISIRVPAEKLNDALEQIKSESSQEPLSEGISSQDVTGDYVDLQSRLTNLETAEEKLRQIMDEAEETEDVLAVYNELVRVREEIEMIKGRMKYLEESAALSSIHTELIADEAMQPLTVGSWQPTGVAKSAIQALINALKFLVNLAIWLAIFVLPVLLILFVFVFLPVRWIVRRLKKNKDQKKSARDVEPAVVQKDK